MATNPFREHRKRMLAKKEAERKAAQGDSAAEPVRREATAQEAAKKQLSDLQLRLKEIRATEGKVAFKRDHLIDLFPYADGVMSVEMDEGDTLPQDDVFMTILVWAFDACMLSTAHKMASFAQQHGWQMPGMFEVKDPAIFIMTRLTAIAAEHAEDPDKMPRDLILDIAADYADADLHDDLGFNVQKMLGELKTGTAPQDALEHYKRAVKIKPQKHGLTKKIQALTTQLGSQSNNDS